MYVCVAGLGLLSSLLITRQVLERAHETTKTGLAEEEIKRQERVDRRKGKKGSVGGLKDLGSARGAETVGERDGVIAGGINEKEVAK